MSLVTDYKFAGTAANVDRDSKNAWDNPDNAKVDNDTRAICDVGKDDYSDLLMLTNFGFTTTDIPDGSNIDGIEVVIDRQAEFGSMSDSSLRLYYDSSACGDDKASALNWPQNSDLSATYGSSTDDWNCGLTDANIRDSSFGIALSAFAGYGLGNTESRVDYIKIRVYYSSPSPSPSSSISRSPSASVSPSSSASASESPGPGNAWVTYYFDSYSGGFKTSPENMVDGSVSTHAITQDNAQFTESLLTNTCPGTDLGTVIKVEIRLYSFNTFSDNSCDFWPVFGGTDNGDSHVIPRNTTRGWTSYYDITSDTNAPGTWGWSDVVDLNCAVRSGGDALERIEVSKVEIRVEYDTGFSASASLSPSSSVSSSESLSLSPSSSVSPSASKSSSLSPSSSTSPSSSKSSSASSSESSSLSPSSSASYSVSPSSSPSESLSPSASISPSSSVSSSPSSSSSLSLSPSSSESASASSSPSSSVSPSPSFGWTNYTRGNYAVLPNDDADLETNYSAQDVIDVSTKNDVRVTQESTGEYAIHQFKDYRPGDTTVLECQLQTNYFPGLSPVYLEIYNRSAHQWEPVDSDDLSAVDIDFTLTAEILDLTDYKDDSGIISCRVYQQDT